MAISPRELRHVVWFSFLGLALYDEQTHTVQPYVLEATGEPLPPPHVDRGIGRLLGCPAPGAARDSVRGAETRFPAGHRLHAQPGHPVGVCAAPDDAAAPPRHAASRQPRTLLVATHAEDSRSSRSSRIRSRSPSTTRRTTRRCRRRSRSSEAAAERRGVRRATARVLDGPRRPSSVSANLGHRGDGPSRTIG